MRRKLLISGIVGCLFLAMAIFGPNRGQAAQEPIQFIGTGNVTGVYYAAGSAVAKMFNKYKTEYGMRLQAEASEGSISNISNVMDGEVAFGIAQANALHAAFNGKGPWEGDPQTELRAVLGLYTEDLTLLAATDAGIEKLEHLRGKRVNIGEMGSTDELTSGILLELAGIDPKTELETSQAPTYEASELLQAEEIDAYFYTVGHPNMSIMESLAGERRVKLVGLDPAFIDSVVKDRPYLLPVTISTTYYSEEGGLEAVRTIGVRAILFTRADQDPQTVYRVVKALLDNADLFRRQHPAFAEIDRDHAVNNLIVPMHPGAASCFREYGLIQ